MEEQNNTHEDEIDLKELFKTIWDSKRFILIFTFIITLFSIIFVLQKTPIYEAKALLEIGSYKSNSNSNSNILIDDVNQLSKKLNLLFIDMEKNIKDKKSEIINISSPKKQKTFLEVTSNAISNELAILEIKKITEHIRKEHKVILEDVKQKRELQIRNLERKIDNIKNNELKMFNDKIKLQSKTILEYKKQLESIDNNLVKIEKTNASLSALRLMEKRDISNFILESNMQLMDMKNKRDTLLTTTLIQLEEEKSLYELLLLPHNYKNTEIIGKILVNDHPVKPKKKLIVLVSFVTGFILSIFLVFFMNFIQGFKKEENQK